MIKKVMLNIRMSQEEREAVKKAAARAELSVNLFVKEKVLAPAEIPNLTWVCEHGVWTATSGAWTYTVQGSVLTLTRVVPGHTVGCKIAEEINEHITR